MMAAASGERFKSPSPASGDSGAPPPRQNGTPGGGQHSLLLDDESLAASSPSTSSSCSAARKCELFTMTGDLIITKASSTKTPATRTQSTPASPGGCDPQRGTKREASSLQSPVAEKKGSFGVRTSRSDDHLGKARGTVAAVSIDIDDDEMASSLNTLLDTKDDPRVLWTYNAAGGSSEDNTATTGSASSSSGRREDLSELECCTSEMASAFGSEEADRVHASELDLSSPSQLSPENEDGFSREEDWLAEPDLSESQFRHPALLDSSLRAAARGTRRMQHSRSNGSTASRTDASETLELDSPPSAHSGGTLDEELAQPPDEASPGATDEESDAESLRSFHYSPKAVDMPSASRLAKRLYNLEGFKKSDVSRHLSKK